MNSRLKGRSGRSMAIAIPAAAVLGFACGGVGVLAQSVPVAESTTGDVTRGWRVFHEKECVDCHAIWDQGGHVGPDLGRSRTGRLSAGQLAGVMWNHIPKMLGQMQETGHAPSTLSREEMSELFSLIFFVRELDEQGNPRRGEQILRSKGCVQCHSVDTSEGGVGPDLAKWGKYANPIVWAQMMWEHAPLMEEAMRRSDIVWPKLEGSDLVHIVAFVRSAGVSSGGERKYLHPGSVSDGQRLFLEKACNQCHPGTGPDLAEADLPQTVGALASRMWNHSPAMRKVMREKDVERRTMSPQELADILAYILALDHWKDKGDAERGARVFEQKGCIHCHEREGMVDAIGPAVTELSGNATPVGMAAAMWNHGATMLERMTEAGLSWPVFDDREMVDLLAYLRTLTPAVRAEGESSAPADAPIASEPSGAPPSRGN